MFKYIFNRALFVFFLCAVIGCTARIATTRDTLSENDAVVLVIVDTQVELYDLAYVEVTNLFSYPIDSVQSVMAYKKKVGETFIVNQVHTLDGR